MKIEEVIDYLECGAVPSCCCANNKRNGGECNGEDAVSEAIHLAVSELRFRIFEKPINTRKYDDEGLYIGYCPICKDGINSEMNFCMKCGQKLDWKTNYITDEKK